MTVQEPPVWRVLHMGTLAQNRKNRHFHQSRTAKMTVQEPSNLRLQNRQTGGQVIVWPCHNELATDEIKQEIDEVYTALTAKDALADLDTLKRFCQSHPEACADTQFKQEYNFYLEGECCNFWIRLITRPKDYNLYLHVFAKSRPK